MRKFYFWMAVLGLAGVVVARAGTNTLSTEVAGKIQLSHVNKFKTALVEDIVPRNSSGVVTTAAGSLGSDTYRWDNVWSDNFKFRRADSSHAVTVRSPAALAAAYSLSWPAALPASTLPLSVSSTGAMSVGQITTAQITDSNVTTAKIADSNVTQPKIYTKTTHASAATAGNVLLTAAASVSPGASTSTTVVSGDLTTTGRPVMVCASNENSAALLTCNSSTNCAFEIRRGGTTKMAVTVNAGEANPIYPCYVDTPAAGTYTYSVVLTTGATLGGSYRASMFAYELN